MRQEDDMPANLRRFFSTTSIRLGPRNPLVRFVIDRKCRQFGARLTGNGAFLSLQKGEREMRLAPKHFVYAPDMAERFDLYFSPLVPTNRDGKLVLDYSQPGILQTYARSGLQFEMASFPEEDEAIDSYFHWYTPEPGDTVFDIGAHCGVSSYHLSQFVGPSGRVIAFEPDPVNFSLLLRNVERHKLTNVTPVQTAIAGACGHSEFNCEETIGSGLMRHSSRASVGKVVIVETVTLEHAFMNWGPAQFCKIDIEGSELEVISAAQQFLRNYRCEFALDTNHLVDGSLSHERVEKLFRECAYESTHSISGMKTTWARPVAIR
jgi:FkbM family methyltransferase